MVDPLTDLEIDVQSFDIPRLVTVYPDKAGMRWWTTNTCLLYTSDAADEL